MSHKISCPACLQQFGGRAAYDNHIKDKHVVCWTCNRSFVSVRSLGDHLQQSAKHLVLRQKIDAKAQRTVQRHCGTCGSVFRALEAFEQHTRAHKYEHLLNPPARSSSISSPAPDPTSPGILTPTSTSSLAGSISDDQIRECPVWECQQVFGEAFALIMHLEGGTCACAAGVSVASLARMALEVDGSGHILSFAKSSVDLDKLQSRLPDPLESFESLRHYLLEKNFSASVLIGCGQCDQKFERLGDLLLHRDDTECGRGPAAAGQLEEWMDRLIKRVSASLLYESDSEGSTVEW